jgi:hypothetical protein
MTMMLLEKKSSSDVHKLNVINYYDNKPNI